MKLVEIVPAPWTSAETVERTRKLMQACGQIPSVLKKEIQGFILNRLQYAVISEAYRLWEDGVAGIEDIDKTMRDALGLRWSFMGPMQTISLNAPGGVPDYDERYGQIVLEVNSSQKARAWDKAAVQRLEQERLRRADRRYRKPESMARSSTDGAAGAQAADVGDRGRLNQQGLGKKGDTPFRSHRAAL